MKIFIAVVQTRGSKFDTLKFQGEHLNDVYPQFEANGTPITVLESHEKSDEYCTGLAYRLNNAKA